MIQILDKVSNRSLEGLRFYLKNKPVIFISGKGARPKNAAVKGIVTQLTRKIDAAFLDKYPHLKAVGNIAVGINNIDLGECRKRGIVVVNTPQVLDRTTAELTLGLLIATARRFHEGNELCRKGRFKGWAPDMLLGQDLFGKTAIVVGRGGVGREVAKIYRAIGLKVKVIHSKTPTTQIHVLLKQADVLSLHMALNEKTVHWLDFRKMKMLKKSAIVINTARGPVVDEKTLIDFLKKRKIWAAGLDVFEREPEIPKALRNLPNVFLLPHIGSATDNTREAMARLAIQGVIDVLSGRRPKNCVQF